MPPPSSTTTLSTTTAPGGGRGGRGRNISRSGGGGGYGGGGYGKLIETLREACPAHKQHDLEKLVKALKGDEEKIREQITVWWDEPVTPVEAEWADVHKRESKPKPSPVHHSSSKPFVNHGSGGSGGRGGGGGGGGGGSGRTGSRSSRDVGGGDRGTRGAGREGGGGRGRGRNTTTHAAGGVDKRTSQTPAGQSTAQDSQTKAEGHGLVESGDPGVPSAANAKPLQGAWAKKSDPSATATPVVPPPLVPDGEALPEPTASANQAPGSVPMASTHSIAVHEATLQSMATNFVAAVAPPKKETSLPSGNVWATRGSAHLILAEKPKPPTPPKQTRLPPVAAPQQTVSSFLSTSDSAAVVAPPKVSQPKASPPVTRTVVAPLVGPVAPLSLSPSPSTPSVNNASVTATAWMPSPKGLSQPSSVALDLAPLPSPVIVESLASVVIVPNAASTTPTSNVLNMGHWETNESDEHNLDFGFGSFGTPDDVLVDSSVVPTAMTSSKSSSAVTPASNQSTKEANDGASGPSPARPPPGLSISGMPPMPANAVLVHDLEGELENASLNAKPSAAATPPPVMAEMHPSHHDHHNHNMNHMHYNNYNNSNNSNNSAIHNMSHNNNNMHMPTAGPTAHQMDATSSLHHPQQAAAYSYGMSMYNYNAATSGGGPSSNAFMAGIATGAPVSAGVPVMDSGLSGPMPKMNSGGPTPSSMSNLSAASTTATTTTGTGLYGSGSHHSAPTSGNNAPPPPPSIPPHASVGGAPPPTASVATSPPSSSVTDNNNNAAAVAGGMPPGMPSMYNPAAVYYSQQPPFHMNQHQGGLGYNYGYGGPQFGGAVQGGFGYHHQMGHGHGQSGGYGHPSHYEDQGTSVGGGNGGGGYGKNSGYRGRNNHLNNNNQYQNQYNPQQHGGYGGQAYGMGYHGGHDFGQRGNYGGMQDLYGMQQQQQQQQQQQLQQHSSGSGGFQDEYKGKKGGRGGIGSFQHQQQQQQHQPNQGPSSHQNFGLSSSSSGGPGPHDSSQLPTTGSGGGGSWSNQQSSSGGWNTGGHGSWQGK